MKVGDEGFVYHVVDDFAWRVERAGLFTCSCTGFGIIRCEQVFKHLSEEFRIQGNFFLYGCVLGDGELIAIENVD